MNQNKIRDDVWISKNWFSLRHFNKHATGNHRNITGCNNTVSFNTSFKKKKKNTTINTEIYRNVQNDIYQPFRLAAQIPLTSSWFPRSSQKNLHGCWQQVSRMLRKWNYWTLFNGLTEFNFGVLVFFTWFIYLILY